MISELHLFSNIRFVEYIGALQKMISRRWIITTIVVVAAAAVMIRLGIWQLDRLEQRRAFNQQVQAQISKPVLILNFWKETENLPLMEYRQITVEGRYDLKNEIALKNQHWQNQSGVHLVTPLLISGRDQAVLIDRGWIPSDAYENGDWSPFAEVGPVKINGVIRTSTSQADFGMRRDPQPNSFENPVKSWNFVNIDKIQDQYSKELLPIYIQQSPDSSWIKLPNRTQPELDLTEGPHVGYAIQWFTFAAILILGYPFFILKQSNKSVEQIRE